MTVANGVTNNGNRECTRIENREWTRLRKACGAAGSEEKRTADGPAVARGCGGQAADLRRWEGLTFGGVKFKFGQITERHSCFNPVLSEKSGFR